MTTAAGAGAGDGSEMACSSRSTRRSMSAIGASGGTVRKAAIGCAGCGGGGRRRRPRRRARTEPRPAPATRCRVCSAAGVRGVRRARRAEDPDRRDRARADRAYGRRAVGRGRGGWRAVRRLPLRPALHRLVDRDRARLRPRCRVGRRRRPPARPQPDRLHTHVSRPRAQVAAAAPPHARGRRGRRLGDLRALRGAR